MPQLFIPSSFLYMMKEINIENKNDFINNYNIEGNILEIIPSLSGSIIILVKHIEKAIGYYNKFEITGSVIIPLAGHEYRILSSGIFTMNIIDNQCFDISLGYTTVVTRKFFLYSKKERQTVLKDVFKELYKDFLLL